MCLKPSVFLLTMKSCKDELSNNGESRNLTEDQYGVRGGSRIFVKGGGGLSTLRRIAMKNLGHKITKLGSAIPLDPHLGVISLHVLCDPQCCHEHKFSGLLLMAKKKKKSSTIYSPFLILYHMAKMVIF